MADSWLTLFTLFPELFLSFLFRELEFVIIFIFLPRNIQRNNNLFKHRIIVEVPHLTFNFSDPKWWSGAAECGGQQIECLK
jgi:hypothetical protein